jgi:hypothetical protein
MQTIEGIFWQLDFWMFSFDKRPKPSALLVKTRTIITIIFNILQYIDIKCEAYRQKYMYYN